MAQASTRFVRRAAVLAVLGIAGAQQLFACQLVAGIDDRKVADSGSTLPDGGGDPCAEVGFPTAPDRSTTAPSDAVESITALYRVDTGTSMGAVVKPWGLNLDKTCTCPASEACAVPAGRKFCDREGGLDNEGAQILAQLQGVAKTFDAGAFFDDSLFNNALQAGLSGVILRVKGYNGQADDAEVQVSIYSSLGTTAPAQWTGNDTWRIDQTYGSLGSPNYETTGWVRGYTLVASPRQIPIVIGSAMVQPVKIVLESGHIVAKLDVMGNQIRSIQGTLSGRWKAREFLKGLQGIPDPVSTGQYLCGNNSATYSLVQAAVCNHRDVPSSPDNDGKGAPCDAVSMSVGFESRPALFGPLEPPQAPPMPCGPMWDPQCP
jgi:hypothetical protein